MFVGLKSFVESLAQGFEAVGVVRRLRSASCIDFVHGCCCCCGLAEGQELDLLVVGHLWGDDYSQLPDPLGFFGSAVPAAVDAGGLRGYGLLEVLLLR